MLPLTLKAGTLDPEQQWTSGQRGLGTGYEVRGIMIWIGHEVWGIPGWMEWEVRGTLGWMGYEDRGTPGWMAVIWEAQTEPDVMGPWDGQTMSSDQDRGPTLPTIALSPPQASASWLVAQCSCPALPCWSRGASSSAPLASRMLAPTPVWPATPGASTRPRLTWWYGVSVPSTPHP